MIEKIIEITIEEAKLSNFKRYRVGAVIFKSNRIYSKGHNYQHKPNLGLPKILRHPYYTIHAEIDAISKLNRKDASNLDMIILRITNTKLSMAKPCIYCQKAIVHLNFRRIYFSNSLGIIEVIKNGNFTSTNIT